MSPKVYVPILWAKEGELGALKQLPAAVKDMLSPFLEVPPAPWDHENDRPAKTIDQHLEKLVARIVAAWGTQESAFLDLEWIPSTERMTDGKHPLTFLFDDARRKGLRLVPVSTLTRDDAYLEAVSTILKKDQTGLCLRVLLDDLETPDIAKSIRRFLDALGCRLAVTDLIVDVKDLPASRFEKVLRDLPRLVERVPALELWRSFAIAGTGFPDSLAGLPKSKMSRIKRTEWDLWRDIRTNRRLARRPAFGDYGISSPAFPDVDPRVMKPSAAIRYTVDGDWVVVKGKNLKDHKFEQFHGLCKDLVASRLYRGRTFSWGDGYIHECARRATGTGSLTTWRKVGTSHHLTFVVKQIASAS